MKTKIILFLILLSGTLMTAQDITVTGLVTTEQDNLPLPGVNVLVKGTSRGTSTDFDGNYSILVSSGEVLEFSSIGLRTQTITVGEQSIINVSMVEDAESLDEIVVIGYGTQKRSDLTGAVSSVKSEDILKQPAANAVQSIQGKLPGVNIINNDAPGATPTVIIRGIGTASAGTEVLYIVDGIQTNGISNINPADIESIDVLKDAASSAIYGMDAANGVVIVTTKRGKKGQAKISISSQYGVQSILNQVEMANAQQFVTYFNENQAFLPDDTRYFLQDAVNQPADTDWYEELADIGTNSINNVAFSGGSENINYFFSYNNFQEDGILNNQKYSRNTIRSNNTFKFFDNKLKISSTASAAFIKSTPKPNGAFNRAYRQAPIVPAFYPDGHFGTGDVNITTGIQGFMAGPGELIGGLNNAGNALADVFYTNQVNRSTDLQGTFEAELQLAKPLKVTTRLGLTKSYFRGRGFNAIKDRFLRAGDPTQDEEDFLDFKAQFPENVAYANNSLNYTQNENFRYNWDTFFSYDKVWGEKHTFGAVAGITRGLRDDFFESSITGYEVPEQEQYWSIEFAESGTYENQSNQFFSTPTTLLSYYGRLVYNYDSKYFIQANFRRDGVSTFRNSLTEGSVNEQEYFGNFPSVSVGWTLTEEEFLKDVNGLDFLKIRAGYGEVGNSNVPENVFQFNTSPVSADTNYIFGPNQDLVIGAGLGSPIRPISWEVTKEINVAMDFRLFNSRLSGSVDLYDRSNEQAIINVQPVLNSAGDQNFFDTGVDVTNKGVEVELSWRDNITQDFSYNFGVIYSYNDNVIENVRPAYDGQTGGSLGNGEITKRLQEGQPLYAWWMFEAEGVWQTQEEIDNNAAFGSPNPGHLRYKDQNGDGIIDDNDKKFFGSYLPTYTVGLNLGFNYKAFDFIVEGFAAGGNKVYNALKGTRINGGENITAAVFNERWTGPGSTNVNPGANRDSYASSYYLEDGDYLRINNITLGYTLKDVIDEISSIRLYATAQNPFLFTNYTGFTPELIGGSGSTGGIELSAYPNTKSFLFGINIEL